MAAALAGALISGVGMYAIGTHTQDRFATMPAANYAAPAPVAQPIGTIGYNAQPAAPAYAVPGYFVAAPQAAGPAPAGYYVTSPQAAAVPVAQQTFATPRRTVYREVAPTPAPVTHRVVETRHRSVAKTALVIGGSTAGAAGLGGLVGGKKGALIGAALGGGAASIYEATRR